MDRYVKELLESRQGVDGKVVCFGDSINRFDVYWSSDSGCWVVVNRTNERLTARRAGQIALLRFDPDADANAEAVQELALASDTESDALYLVDVERLGGLSSCRNALALLWRSDGKSGW